MLPWDHLGRSLLRGFICSDEVVDVPLSLIAPLGSLGFVKMGTKACILTLRPQTFCLQRNCRDTHIYTL